MSKPFDLLIAGEINPDLILSDPNLEPRFGQVELLVEQSALTMGSSSVIFACGAARLGLKTSFIGVVGCDLFGEYMLDGMQQRGIDTRHIIRDQHQRTGFSVILNRGGDRAILTFPGAMNALTPTHLSDSLLQQARHLHIASYFLQTNLQPGLPDIFKNAHSLGLTTSLDANWDPAEQWQGLSNLLPHTDIFFPNQQEAQAIAGASTLDDAMDHLSQENSTVVVKLGDQGAIAKQADQVVRLPALFTQVADTVGAGDNFDAGFLFGYLQGWDLERSLALAIACGSLSTRAHGGVDAQPTLEEAQQAMRQILQG